MTLRRACLVLAVLLCTLAACETSSPTSGVSPTVAGTAGIGTPTAPVASGPFQLQFAEQYAVVACSGSEPAGTLCVATTGTGQGHNNGASLGPVSLARSSVYAPAGSDSCGPATTRGTLTLAGGDTITFSGTGAFCRAQQTATFTYTITGGTGRYLRAGGTGAIVVPTPQSASAGSESWSGTLTT
jgi:hypothetical protein